MDDLNLGQLARDKLVEAFRERGHANVLIAGRTGVGKSTLINSVFQGNFATTGQGRPVTKNTREITKEDVTNSYAQLFNIPVSYAQESLQAARFPVQGYDDLTAEEVHRHISGLSLEELKVVRDYKESTKKRNTVLEELDRKIRSGS